MRKVYGTGLIAILILSGIFCFTNLNIASGKYGFAEIKVNEVARLIQEQESGIVYYGKDTCSACRVFAPLLQQASEQTETQVYFLDGDNLENKKFSQELNIAGTPTLLVINKGHVQRYEGVLELSETVALLEDQQRKGES